MGGGTPFYFGGGGGEEGGIGRGDGEGERGKVW